MQREGVWWWPKPRRRGGDCESLSWWSLYQIRSNIKRERERERPKIGQKRLALRRTIAADEFAAVVQLIRERGLCGGEEPSGSATVDVTDWDRHRESSNTE